MSRVYNFCAGPAVLPVEVLEQARDQMLDFQGTGMSIMESSHRGKAYEAMHNEAIANIKTLMGLNDDYAVLFLQGGASMQFAMVPMNLLGAGQTADYTNSGEWASKAIKEAKKIGAVNVVADCGKEIPTRVPRPAELKLSSGAAYVHITSNETISGAQWKSFPKTEATLVADMSSNILSRQIDVSKFGLIYAGAQKNIGPAGLTLVIVRDDLIGQTAANTPTMLDYKTHADNGSMYNTPPTYGIYIAGLVFKLLKARGGLVEMEKINRLKAGLLYDFLDATDFYSSPVARENRSLMNIPFTLKDAALDEDFLKGAKARNLVQLKGHRSVGGMRASIYNAMPAAGVAALVAYMKEFEAKHG